jgi:hypothetical protein
MAKWRERHFRYLLLTFHTPYESLVELYEEEKHRKSLSYEADSPHFCLKRRYFAFLKARRFSFSTSCYCYRQWG